jgi:lipopolysaccharide transport system permease protein
MDPVQHRPHSLVLRSRRTLSLSTITELWEFRGLIVRFAKRDVILRYRQTALGVVWVLLQPILGAAVLAFAFGTVAGVKGPDGVPFFVFAYFGYLAFALMASSFTKAADSVRANSAMVTKVFFPRAVLPLASLASAVVDFLVAFSVGVILLLVTGIGVTFRIIAMPAVVLLAVVVGLGPGLVAAALMVRYRDVQYVLPVAVQILLYGSPVAYEFSSAPERAQTILRLNPGVGVTEALRWVVLPSDAVDGRSVISAAVIGVVFLLFGLAYFTLREEAFADVI